MNPNAALDVAIGSDVHLNPVDGTSTDARICVVALHPLARNIFAGASYTAAR